MIHVLIVDPDVQSSSHLEEILARRGCVVETAETFDRGLQLSREARFDVIFCAIDPKAGRPAKAVLNFLRHFPTVPKVAVSAGGTIKALEPLAQVVTAGVDDFLTRPFSLDGVNAVLARILFPGVRKESEAPHEDSSPPPFQRTDEE